MIDRRQSAPVHRAGVAPSRLPMTGNSPFLIGCLAGVTQLAQKNGVLVP